MTEPSETPERLMKLDEVCRRVGLGKSMIYDMIRQGRFPPPYKIGADILRRHQPHFVTARDEQTAEVMSTAACVHRDYAER